MSTTCTTCAAPAAPIFPGRTWADDINTGLCFEIDADAKIATRRARTFAEVDEIASARANVSAAHHAVCGKARPKAPKAAATVAVGSWVEFPSRGVPFAPGEGHGWRVGRIVSIARTRARVEWWNRRGIRSERTVSLSDCRATYARKAPTPESAAAKLRERARAARLERIARRGY